ncbi:hypothetical protein SA2016_1034 [Sinomonas atrocyanea]|uniref:Uncharacterized protein n=2 Tax=Sinomonas atrocyanea TaxID=37927 RepID=A0A126ZX06_9MICC|nr:hypothetical protein SA2016_1034 [Sinomonas atrocyanea]GEB66109.1 hypothetical protein SAT01_35570 [Sinomonas atrocyanea]GGG59522.1 hypothetical protein GCM10007172_07970 [Sinomonas atrocyanea]
MLEVLHEARRRGMSHSRYSLQACRFLLVAHAPAGQTTGTPCEGCLERWPCHTVLGVLGGLKPTHASRPASHDREGNPR